MSLINQMLKDLDARRSQPAPVHVVALQGLGLASGRNTSQPVPWVRVATAVTLTSFVAALLVLQPWNQPAAPARHIATAHKPVETPAAITPPTEPRVTPEQLSVSSTIPETALADKISVNTARGNHVQQQKTVPNAVATPAAETTTPQPVVRLNPHQRARAAFRRALLMLERDDDRAAETLLRKALSLDAGLSDARVQLAALLLREQHLVDAEMLLIEGLTYHSDQLALAELYARLLVERGDNNRALEVLDTAGAAHSELAEVRALRAGILMKLGDARKAALNYQKALAASPQQAVWWMGLGVALEQAGETTRALSAYRRAHSLPLATELYNFVVKRIAMLDGNSRNRE